MRLVLHDWAGEVFSSLDIAEDNSRILERAKILLVVYSIRDLRDLRERSMDELLMSYRSTMSRLGQRAKRQKPVMIITLSKADLLDDLPDELVAYLRDDPFVSTNVIDLEGLKSAEGIAQYIHKMERVSNIIRRWLGQTNDGMRFLNIARGMNIELRFTICSALGASVSDATNRLSSPFVPTRVLDPIFWLFEIMKSR